MPKTTQALGNGWLAAVEQRQAAFAARRSVGAAAAPAGSSSSIRHHPRHGSSSGGTAIITAAYIGNDEGATADAWTGQQLVLPQGTAFGPQGSSSSSGTSSSNTAPLRGAKAEAWAKQAVARLNSESRDCGSLAITEIAETAAALRLPASPAFSDALCSAALRAAPTMPVIICFRLAAALAAAQIPAPPQLRSALAARIEGGAWEVSAAVLSHAVGHMQRMGHVWDASAAWGFLERTAAALPGHQDGCFEDQEQQQLPHSSSQLEAQHVGDLLLALCSALQQAPSSCRASSRGTTTTTSSSNSAASSSVREEEQHDVLLRLWRHAVDRVSRPNPQQQQQQEGSSSATADAAEPILRLLQVLHAVPSQLRADPATQHLFKASLAVARGCPLPQLVPLMGALRAVGAPLQRRVLLRIANEPLAVLSSAKLAAVGSALRSLPPGAQSAGAAAAALAAEVSSRLAAGRLPPPAVGQLVAALPHLVRLAWPADAAVALMVAAEVAVPVLQPAQLWEVQRALELLEPKWAPLAASAAQVWVTASPLQRLELPASSSQKEGVGSKAAAVGADGLLPRPVYPGPPPAEASSSSSSSSPPQPADGAVAVLPAPPSHDLNPAHAAAEQLRRLQHQVRAALSAIPAERLPAEAAPPSLDAAVADTLVDQSLPSPRRQALAALMRTRALLAAPGLTPDWMAAVCVGVVRLFGGRRLRRAAVREAKQRAATQRTLEAAAWVWMQQGGGDGMGAAAGAADPPNASRDQQAGATGGLLDGPQLALVLRALVTLGADPHASVAERVAAAAYASLGRLPPRQLARALQRLASLRLPRRCRSWDALLLRLLVVRGGAMRPGDALACAHATVLGLGFRPTPVAAAPLMRRMLAPEALDTLTPMQLVQLAQLVNGLRAEEAAPNQHAHAHADAAPLLQALSSRMEAFNARQLVALGVAVGGWDSMPTANRSMWMRQWLRLLFVRVPEMSTAEVSASPSGGRGRACRKGRACSRLCTHTHSLPQTLTLCSQRSAGGATPAAASRL